MNKRIEQMLRGGYRLNAFFMGDVYYAQIEGGVAVLYSATGSTLTEAMRNLCKEIGSVTDGTD